MNMKRMWMVVVLVGLVIIGGCVENPISPDLQSTDDVGASFSDYAVGAPSVASFSEYAVGGASVPTDTVGVTPESDYAVGGSSVPDDGTGVTPASEYAVGGS